MDEIPNLESCNKCSCDFGEIICTEEVCNNQTKESISDTDFDELIEYEYESIPDVTTSLIPSSTSTQGNLLEPVYCKKRPKKVQTKKLVVGRGDI